MRNLKKQFFLFFVLMVFITSSVSAQNSLLEKETVIRKVDAEDAEKFEKRFNDIKWTGEGFQFNSLDRIPAIEIRARLQSEFGDPTKTIENIVEDGKLRIGQAIQFEYWFIIDGEIPMMVLDLDGPFADGLVYAGASRYIDLMPQVKRTLTRQLTENEPKEYTDFYYEPNAYQWYKVSYKNGVYKKEKVSQPSHIKLN